MGVPTWPVCPSFSPPGPQQQPGDLQPTRAPQAWEGRATSSQGRLQGRCAGPAWACLGHSGTPDFREKARYPLPTPWSTVWQNPTGVKEWHFQKMKLQKYTWLGEVSKKCQFCSKGKKRDSQVENTSTDGQSTLAGSMRNDDFFFTCCLQIFLPRLFLTPRAEHTAP